MTRPRPVTEGFREKQDDQTPDNTSLLERSGHHVRMTTMAEGTADGIARIT